MQCAEAFRWLSQGERRQRILMEWKQPMTARQLSKRTGMSLDTCSHVISELKLYGLVVCLNGSAGQSRVYWLTALGDQCQRKLLKRKGQARPDHEFPEVDWDLYGWVCFSHRSAIIRALSAPMQPSEIKRRALNQNPNLRMSANNVRDVIRLFLERGLVETVNVRGKAHFRYELTDVGKSMQRLLWGALK